MRILVNRTALLVGALALSSPLLAFDGYGSTKRASVSSAEAQGNANSGTGPIRALQVSADGNFVVFLSTAGNLVAGDTNGVRDVFVRDCTTGVTTRVNVPVGGGQANGDSYQPTISGDGRFVAYSSDATNLVPDDPNSFEDVFLRDRLTGTTQRISTSTTLPTGNSRSSGPNLSADGRYVCFTSVSSDLVSGDTNGVGDVFVYDRVADSLQRINFSVTGAQANGHSGAYGMSADGRFVVFGSHATNLIEPDTNGSWDVFVLDRQLVSLERIGPASPQQWSDGATDPSISDDGRWVAFESTTADIVAGDTNGLVDVFVYDRMTSTVQRVSESSSGVQGNGISEDAAISGSGQYVTFESQATNLVGQDTNNWLDVFRHHLATDTTERMSSSHDEQQATGLSAGASISANGNAVAFVSFASNLVAGDTNSHSDVFVRHFGGGAVGNIYCVGATNSAGLNGTISAAGSVFTADNDFTLVARNTPPNKSGIFFYGPNQIQAPFGDGFRCVGGNTQRIPPVVSTGPLGIACGQLNLQVEPASSRITSMTPIVMNFQFWHRDSMGSTNLTNAVEVRFL